MDEIPLISVIVPVYKVENYLDQCVSSITNQTYKNLEIILVDDGSPDRCGTMCDRWKKKDDRIKVVHKTNGGLSDARNSGLRIATGDFISFVDSDDWIDKEMLSVLYKGLKKSNSQISICKLQKVLDGEKEHISADSLNAINIDGDEALRQLIVGRISQVVWNKLYEKTIIEDIDFEVGKYHEDEFWSYQIFGRAKKIVSIDYTGYYYRQRAGSIMGEKYSVKRLDAIEAKCRRQKYLKKYKPKLESVGKINLLFSCLYHGQLALATMQGAEKKQVLKRLKWIYAKTIVRKADLKHMSATHQLWFMMGKSFFCFTCYVRNLMKIGF